MEIELPETWRTQDLNGCVGENAGGREGASVCPNGLLREAIVIPARLDEPHRELHRHLVVNVCPIVGVDPFPTRLAPGWSGPHRRCTRPRQNLKLQGGI